MNIYIFTSEPFDKNKIKDYDLEFVEKIGYKIRVINLIFLSKIQYANQELNRFISHKYKNEIFCKNINEIQTELKNIKQNELVLYNVASIDYKKFVYIIKFLNENNIRYGIIANMNSKVLHYNSVFRTLISKLEKKSVLSSIVIRRIVRKIKKPYFYPKFIITAGENTYKYNKFTYGSRPIYFNIPSIDYHKSLNVNPTVTDTLRFKKYNVLIEQADPFHPDQNHIIQDRICATEYYNKIGLFLKDLEKKTGLETLIALPPKTKLYFPELTNYFPNHVCFINRTPELIMYSDLVIMQKSTAISFALLYHKPILFFSYLNSGTEYQIIKKLANYFKSFVYSLSDDLSNLEIDKKCNIDIYNEYIKDYIFYSNAISLSENQYFINYLNKI